MESHVERVFVKLRKSRYAEEGTLNGESLTLGDFCKLALWANWFDDNARPGLKKVRQADFENCFPETLHELPTLVAHRVTTEVGLSKHEKHVGRTRSKKESSDGIVGRTEFSILFQRFQDKFGERAGFVSPMAMVQVLHTARRGRDKEDEKREKG